MPERNHHLPPEIPEDDPLLRVEALKHVVEEQAQKIQLLVEFLDSSGLLEDHCFTFPDGDIWKTQDVKPIEPIE